MPFFKIRSAGQKGADEPTPRRGPAESVEVLRRRARHRLIGAALLVLVGIVGFPLLFDTQPRPIPVDIPIEIPDKNKVKPLALPSEAAAFRRAGPAEPAPAAPPQAAASKPAASANAAPAVAASASLGAREEVVAARTEPKSEKPATARAEAKPAESKPAEAKVAESKPAAKPAAKSDDGAKARALLEGKPEAAATAATAADAGRFIVQVGAYSEAARVREARQKVEKAGLKTYTQEVDTPDGKRVRVRVGPFGTRAEADKAAAKIKGLDLPASILSL